MKSVRQETVRPTAEAVDRELERVAFDANGLVCGIAQQHDSGEVLMVAWLNRDALRETLLTGQVCYWSRSRQSLWRKGETSGQVQKLVEARLDCDGDAVLLLVDQTATPDGVAVSTGSLGRMVWKRFRTRLLHRKRSTVTEAERKERGRQLPTASFSPILDRRCARRK